MNSFYKKIALACLVSLTVNQATRTFQFSDVLGWIQNNPKKSLAIGLCLLIANAVVYKVLSSNPVRPRARTNNTRPVQPTPAAPVSAPAQEESDEGAADFVPAHYEYATYVDQACLACTTEKEFNRLTGEYQNVPARSNVRSLDTLSDADHKRLAELSPNPYQPGKSYYPPDSVEWRDKYIAIARDQNKDIIGCLWYWHGYGDFARVHILNAQGPHAQQIKKELLKPLLHARKHDTTKYDISIYGDSPDRSLVRKTIQEIDGRVRQDRKASETECDVFRRNDPEVDDLFRARITYGGGKNSVKWCNDDEVYPKPGQVPSVQYYEDNDLRGLEERRARGRRLLEMRRKEQAADTMGHESFADLRRAGDVAPASLAV